MRIHRYIAREVLVPMRLGLVVFTFVLLMGRILKLMELVLNKGVPLKEILALFVSLLPTFLVITLPLAFLLGVLIGFGRLSSDSEVVALKASGVSLNRMLRPVLLIGLAVSIVTATLTLYAEPAGNASFRNRLFTIATRQASVAIQPNIFNTDFKGLVLFAREVDERSGKMQGIFISDERIKGGATTIIAREGEIISDSKALSLTLKLHDGSIHRRENENDGAGYQLVRFATYDVNLNMGQDVGSSITRRIKEKELSLGKLLDTLRAGGDATRLLAVELHRRLMLPLVPLIFALVGVALGVRSHRSAKGGGFAMALVVFLAYYILFSLAKTLAVERGFPPFPTLWLPNLFFLVGGIVLFRQAAKEKSLQLPSLRELLRSLMNRGRRA